MAEKKNKAKKQEQKNKYAKAERVESHVWHGENLKDGKQQLATCNLQLKTQDSRLGPKMFRQGLLIHLITIPT